MSIDTLFIRLLEHFVIPASDHPFEPGFQGIFWVVHREDSHNTWLNVNRT